MRFLTTFNDERKAYACTNYFHDKGIETIYEPSGRAEGLVFSIWVINEDDYEKACEQLTSFEKLTPEEALRIERPRIAPISKITTSDSQTLRVQLDREPPPKKGRFALTNGIILLCAILFFWNTFQEATVLKEEGPIALELGLTPLQRDLFFDDPPCLNSAQDLLKEYPVKSIEEIKALPPDVQLKFASIEHCPFWKGIWDTFYTKIKTGKGSYTSLPLFEKVREGEVWRLFTPCLLHRDFLHILFNMSWVFVLGRMIEDRAGKLRMIGLIFVIAIVSNIAQYLMSGPFFLGFSGVVCGMVGFIWMRQRMSPWEGYPLSSGMTLFLVLFIVAMLILQLVSVGLEFFGVQGIASAIANTAHIVGGLTGLLLARIPLFSRNP